MEPNAGTSRRLVLLYIYIALASSRAVFVIVGGLGGSAPAQNGRLP